MSRQRNGRCTQISSGARNISWRWRLLAGWLHGTAPWRMAWLQWPGASIGDGNEALRSISARNLGDVTRLARLAAAIGKSEKQ